jgi:2-amino-4-hydroxy-6-hydroxymethyldihydropteridine diphosphokinase
VKITAVSAVYETAPWGMTDQPDFLNMCVGGLTGLTPAELLEFVKRLERQLGRTPGERWGPRVIDIDILFYDDLIFESIDLTIPHAGAAERATVLAPLSEIAPHLLHPRLGKTVQELLANVELQGVRLVGQL